MPGNVVNITSDLHERRVTLNFPDLPAAADGLRICLVADLHAKGPHPLFRRLVGWLGAHEFDAGFCGGDLQYGTDAGADVTLAVARTIFAARRPRLGWFVVRGNNDRRSFFKRLAAPGVRLLANESARLLDSAPPLVLAGVDDPHYRHDDLDAALDGVPEDAFTILLAHSPDVIHKAAARGVRLVLSGHTHGGQVRLPFAGALFTQTRVGVEFAYGLSRRHDTWLYTTSGVGYALMPLRLNCPAEVVSLTLRRASGDHVDSGPLPIR